MAFSSSLPCSSSASPSGMTWNALPMVTSAALIGDAGRVERETGALGPHGVAEELDGELVLRGEPAEEHHRGQGEGDERADEAVADHRTTGEAGLLVGVGEDLGRGGLRLGGAADRVALVGELDVGHERLAPVHDAEAEAEEGERRAEADEHVVQAHLADVVRLDREEHVGRDGPDAAEDRQVEERVDRAGRALLALGVLVGDAGTVGRETGVLERVGRDQRRTRRRGGFVRGERRVGSGELSAAVVVLCHGSPSSGTSVPTCASWTSP